jgi:4-hydroxy-3-methylbut-2-enyl diphosphate reductase
LGFNITDATCPRVIKIQTIIKKYAKQNHAIIIIGDANHPEVIGLLGHAGEKGYAVDSLDKLKALPVFEKAIIVAQTTQNTQLFEEVKNWVQSNYAHYKIFETICDSTEKRQAEVKKLAASVDAMLIVGGLNSGNTQRLAKIAKDSGKPAFHIESEADLESIDAKMLTAAPCIGITAGASTPNWIIKRVYRALEQLPYKQKPGWRSTLFAIQRALLLTNIYVSLGAGLLCYACTKLQGISNYWPYIYISMLYVHSMHTFNHLTGTQADQYNDPDRAAFYQKYKPLLILAAIIAGGAGLLIAFSEGIWPFMLLLTMSIMGLSYNLPLLPESLRGIRYRSIRDIPGSKTVLIAMAWGIVVALLPPLSTNGEITWVNGLIFMWSTGIVFFKTLFFDILDMQGDRIIGRETLAIFLGEKQSMRLLDIVAIVLIVMLPLFSVYQFVPALGFVLTLCPVFILMVILAYRKGLLLPGIRLEFLVETHFILAGLLTFIWTVIDGTRLT